MKPKLDVLIEQIHLAKGNISAVARAFDNTPRSTVKRWIEGSHRAQQAVQDARERLVDAAENVLYRKAIEEQELTAVFYVMNNSPESKRRGWGPRTEVTGKDGGDITVKVVFEDLLGGDDA